MFYKFYQNNSGGGWRRDERGGKHVYIEAASVADANVLAKKVGIYFNGVADGIDCECCGDRWLPAYEGSSDVSLDGVFGTESGTLDECQAGTIYLEDDFTIYFRESIK